MTSGRLPLQASIGLVALDAGYYGFLATLPLALGRSGVPDAQIGLIVGAVAIVQVPTALIGGALVDRLGAGRVLAIAAAAYLFGALVLVSGFADPAASLAPFVLARVAQGVGFSLVRPAWLSLVPQVLPARGAGTGMGIAMSVQNLSLIVVPPPSLLVLGDGDSLTGVAAFVAAAVAVGALLLFSRYPRLQPSNQPDPSVTRRRYGLAFRRTWLPPLALMMLYLIHWGVITAYLPQRAELGAADVGLFFAMDGLFSLVLRVPSGWLVDRVHSRWLVLPGILLSGVGVSLLLLPVTTPILVLAGALTGIGSVVIVTPIYAELFTLSSANERGSAFALVSAATASGTLLGSAGLAPLVAAAGFEAAIVVAMACFVVAILVAVADSQLGKLHSAPQVA